MQLIGKLNQDKRGVSSIIGATFLVFILLSGFTFYILTVNINEDYTDVLQTIDQLDLQKKQENVEFVSVSTTNEDKLNVTVKNAGSHQTHLIWLGIFDETVTPNTQEYHKTDVYINPAETLSNLPEENITILEGQERVIQLVTELGNTFNSNYPPREEATITITGKNCTTAHNPSQWNLLGSTEHVSGSISDLANDDASYVFFRSYQTASSDQPLYAHSETTIISGSPYYLQKLTSADGTATSMSASMDTLGRQLFGKFVYPLTGVNSIPASTWTTYYRAWEDTAPSITFDGVGSGNNGGGSTSISWSHTTGSGSNRIMIVGVSIRTTTVSVSAITYGAQSLAFIRADTHASATIRSELWYLIAPNSGTATVTVTLSESSKATGGSCTYTGVAQTSPIDANSGVTGTSSSPSQSITVGTANSMLLGHVAISGSRDTISLEGTGQTLRWDQETTQGNPDTRNRGHGSDKGPVGAGSQTMSWTLSASADWAVSVVAIKPAPAAVGHADIDILIRQSDGTIRSTIATNVAVSGDLTSTPTTLSGTYAWIAYTVVDQTDYLEIDYYVDVTTAAVGINAYLRIDDTTLAISDQTRITNILLPSEYTAEVEFTGSSNLLNWTQLVWQIDSAWDVGQVTVTIQFFNFTLGDFASSGNGYTSYISSVTPNIDELKSQSIDLNPNDFKNSTGQWRVKIKGVKATSTQFLFKVDWVNFETTYSTTGSTVPYNIWQWYTIRATTAGGGPIPYGYVSIYANGTSVAFRNATDKASIANPAWVRLDARGELQLEIKSTTGSPETFVLYAVVGSVVGKKTITQEVP